MKNRFKNKIYLGRSLPGKNWTFRKRRWGKETKKLLKLLQKEKGFITEESESEDKIDEEENDWDQMKHPSSIHGKLCHPTAESQLLGKWFGGIYETTKKKNICISVTH